MKHILLAACAVAILSGCGSQGKQAAPTENPFLSEYTTCGSHVSLVRFLYTIDIAGAS